MLINSRFRIHHSRTSSRSTAYLLPLVYSLVSASYIYTSPSSCLEIESMSSIDIMGELDRLCFLLFGFLRLECGKLADSDSGFWGSVVKCWETRPNVDRGPPAEAYLSTSKLNLVYFITGYSVVCYWISLFYRFSLSTSKWLEFPATLAVWGWKPCF